MRTFPCPRTPHIYTFSACLCFQQTKELTLRSKAEFLGPQRKKDKSTRYLTFGVPQK